MESNPTLPFTALQKPAHNLLTTEYTFFLPKEISLLDQLTQKEETKHLSCSQTSSQGQEWE